MFYKGIILDLDDTIYNYKNTHTISLTCVLNFMRERFNIIGIDLEKITNFLESDGVSKFETAWLDLMNSIKTASGK